MTNTLKKKFLFWSLALVTGVLLLGLVSIWNLASLWHTATGARAQYELMDRADGVSQQIAWLRDALRAQGGASVSGAVFFAPIQKEVTEIRSQISVAKRIDEADGATLEKLGQSAEEHLHAAMRFAGNSAGGATGASPPDLKMAANELDQLRNTLQEASKIVPGATRRHITSAPDRLASRLQWTCFWLIVVLAISAAIHLTQYRSLVRPMLTLREDMKKSAANHYSQPIAPRGEKEHKDVAGFFNTLATELNDLYRDLEAKVISRSKELVRAERLASVGFLAAGVAHEINNPLSIISGYAELAAKSLRRVMLGEDANEDSDQAEAEAQALGSALDAQEIIREEAFRCKEITSRLLSLARSGGEGRHSVNMDEVARQVTVLTKGLKNYRDRRIILDFKPDETLAVIANPSEMKQVFLNLTVNALEASPAEKGEVRIGGRRSGQWVELFVEDNGKGMTPETLEHVFEPFFTAKRGAAEPGTGLGLSITHAIVSSHGGGIEAASAGPGRGSRFTVRLPVGRS